ncbi:hypothetical protein CC86DRAFT_409527 [Ophiobolus disseminans]|uniref:Mid2 domain-containing protein n=1 Tax=Ophiobolus disseminans TaxID=1469910 RepID=A0A6A6ZNS0_9PLEO|nr:hypothetical protein CC86DRAFT_409527 [Ophiobolus disseminans]
MKVSLIFNIVAALSAAHAVAFRGPVPTDTSPSRVYNGMSPKPTNGPTGNELRKRQSNLSPEICGWVDGDLSSAVSCTIGSCMLYKSAAVGMAGCCLGSDRQSCGWAKSCVGLGEYAAGSCGSNCILDTFTRKCTDVAAPFCITWTYPGEGVADYGCDSTSTNTISTIRPTARNSIGRTTSISLPTVAAAAVIFPLAGSGTTSTRRVKKIAVGTVIGIVVAVLFLLFFVAIGVFMFIKKKKKNQQIAANASIVAANRPQSQYQPPPQMQQGPPPPMSPQPANNGYFAPPNQQEQKYNGYTSVHEYAMTPISNPPTPAPQYSQPHGAPTMPPMPQQQYQYTANGAHEVPAPVPQQNTSPVQQQHTVSPVQRQTSPPAAGAHEVDATSVPHAPGKTGPVYEIGSR